MSTNSNDSVNVVTIRELEQDEPARALFGMNYFAKLTTDGFFCGCGYFAKTIDEVKEWAEGYADIDNTMFIF